MVKHEMENVHKLDVSYDRRQLGIGENWRDAKMKRITTEVALLGVADISLTACSKSENSEHSPAEFTSQIRYVEGSVHDQTCIGDWAPFGADRFYELVKAGFYNEARFFRIVPNFIVQWGILKDPSRRGEMARSKYIPDDSGGRQSKQDGLR